MAEEAKTNTQEAAATEVKTPVEKAPETPAVKEETVSDALGTKEPVKREPETVGLDKFLEIKNENKQFKKDIAALTKRLDEGASRVEISSDIDEILNEYNLDDTNKQFFSKLTKALEIQADKKAEDKMNAKLVPLEKKERDEKIDAAFKKHFKDALERNPEYENIAVPSVIKAMSLVTENADKTFSQILEEAYGNSIQGKKTIETTTPGGGKEPQPVDFSKAKSDPKYFEEVMANPAMKAEYNKDLARRLRL